MKASITRKVRLVFVCGITTVLSSSCGSGINAYNSSSDTSLGGRALAGQHQVEELAAASSAPATSKLGAGALVSECSSKRWVWDKGYGDDAVHEDLDGNGRCVFKGTDFTDYYTGSPDTDLIAATCPAGTPILKNGICTNNPGTKSAAPVCPQSLDGWVNALEKQYSFIDHGGKFESDFRARFIPELNKATAAVNATCSVVLKPLQRPADPCAINGNTIGASVGFFTKFYPYFNDTTDIETIISREVVAGRSTACYLSLSGSADDVCPEKDKYVLMPDNSRTNYGVTPLSCFKKTDLANAKKSNPKGVYPSCNRVNAAKSSSLKVADATPGISGLFDSDLTLVKAIKKTQTASSDQITCDFFYEGVAPQIAK